MFPSTSSRETLRFSGNKIHCSPRDQSLSVNYNTSRRRVFPQLFRVLVNVNFYEYLYNSDNMFSILFRKQRDEKRKTTC